MSASSAVDAPLLALSDCRVSYGEVEALRGVDLAVARCERVAVIGASGAGKSTLLRALYRAAPERCALVAQSYDLVHQLSVFANVDAGRLDQRSTVANLRNLVWPRGEDRSAVEALLDELGLAGLARRRSGELSGGQQQRVAVARALHAGREVVLADEPVSAVDPSRADAVLGSIVARSGACVLAMHAMGPVLQACTRVVALREGRIAFDRPREEVAADDLQQFFDAG